MSDLCSNKKSNQSEIRKFKCNFHFCLKTLHFISKVIMFDKGNTFPHINHTTTKINRFYVNFSVHFSDVAIRFYFAEAATKTFVLQ